MLEELYRAVKVAGRAAQPRHFGLGRLNALNLAPAKGVHSAETEERQAQV